MHHPVAAKMQAPSPRTRRIEASVCMCATKQLLDHLYLHRGHPETPCDAGHRGRMRGGSGPRWMSADPPGPVVPQAAEASSLDVRWLDAPRSFVERRIAEPRTFSRRFMEVDHA